MPPPPSRADSVEAALAAPAGAGTVEQPHLGRGRHHRREGRTAPRAHADGRQVRGLPAQDQQGPAARRSASSSPTRATTRRPRAASRSTSRSPTRRTSRATRSPRPTSRRSVRSSPRSPATRASPRRPCPKIVEGRVDRLLQAGRPARAGLREGQQAVRRPGREGRRPHRDRLRPLQGRRVTPLKGSASSRCGPFLLCDGPRARIVCTRREDDT